MPATVSERAESKIEMTTFGIRFEKMQTLFKLDGETVSAPDIEPACLVLLVLKR